jgi:DNA-binding NtrC family response regulator
MFRKFASDIAERYRMPVIQLNEEARLMLINYRWPGNVRQLKNITEQLSVIESERIITPPILRNYLTEPLNELPALYNKPYENSQDFSERELMYKILFEMRRDINDMKKIIADHMIDGNIQKTSEDTKPPIIQKLYDNAEPFVDTHSTIQIHKNNETDFTETIQDSEIIEESLSLEGKEKDLIKRALQKNRGRRKKAATELGISERTLYRKIKEYGLEE